MSYLCLIKIILLKMLTHSCPFKSVISKGINDAGRGLNIVVVGNGKEVLSVGHFDTYAEGHFNFMNSSSSNSF